MTAEKLANAILNKCDIYYGDALISREIIIEKYLAFFADSLVSKERTVNFALHTGSICFDVISVVAVALGCLSYNLSTSDDIIASLQIDEMIMFKGQRYRWKGLQEVYGNQCMVLEQDGKGKNGKATSYLPMEKNKHLIKPYYGDSNVTDGRGVRRKKTNREDFLSFAFAVDIEEIPAQIDVSIVIVADKNEFNEICRNVCIKYGDGKTVGLLDIVPASYFTGSGEEHQFGFNPTKAEPVLKVTGKMSTARDLVLDRHGNKVVGLLVTGGISVIENGSELSDLLHRKVLRFIHVTSPMKTGIGEHILDLYDDAALFACTKEFLSLQSQDIRSPNSFTEELHRQISNVVENSISTLPVPSGWSWKEYQQIKDSLWALKQSNWSESDCSEFVVTAYGVLNLLNTAVFTMESLEEAIDHSDINHAVISPKKRIERLWNLADQAGSLQEPCMIIADALERKYNEYLKASPKDAVLNEYMISHLEEKIAIVVPKAYYSDLLRKTHPEYFETGDVICVTANRFDASQEYDIVLCVGEINNKKFNPLQCTAAKNVVVILYDCEGKVFSYRKQKQIKSDQRLNEKIGITRNAKNDVNIENHDLDSMDESVSRFSELDEYINEFSFIDIKKIAQNSVGADGTAPVSEVKHIGAFVTGEQIFFSKFYSAVVYDSSTETISEKSPEQLLPGDVLVFLRRDDYTQNIVDYIFEKLLRGGRLGSDAVDAYEKSQYWKEALREYKEINNLTYRKVAKELRNVGCSVQEVSVRQWLIDGSHIVGPRKETTLEQIAMLTKDTFLLQNTHAYFEACGIVRHDRRKILDFIAKAINDKLSGKTPEEGSVLSVVYENVDRLSETLELENITELDDTVCIGINLVNTPITEAEVSM